MILEQDVHRALDAAEFWELPFVRDTIRGLWNEHELYRAALNEARIIVRHAIRLRDTFGGNVGGGTDIYGNALATIDNALNRSGSK